MLAHHESGRLKYDADLDSSLDVVAERELARLLGPSASLEQVVGEALQAPLILDTGPGAETPAKPKPRKRSA